MSEKKHSINGVSGRYWVIKNPGVRADHCHDAQKWVSEQRPIDGYGEPAFLRVSIRHDDECKNGHNSFSITGEVIGKIGRYIAGGCLHDDIERAFPELAHLIKWHLSSTDGPMHYIANTLYWLGYQGYCGPEKNNPPNIDFARKSAVWLDMPESLVCPSELQSMKVGESKQAKTALSDAVADQLASRLPALLKSMQADIESIGFEFSYSDAFAHESL
jgi:hypothetical protein